MGLMLKYKKYKDKYFDYFTDLEFSRDEISKHHSWYKQEYDNNGNKIYYEADDGYWIRWEFNNDGDLISIEDSFKVFNINQIYKYEN